MSYQLPPWQKRDSKGRIAAVENLTDDERRKRDLESGRRHYYRNLEKCREEQRNRWRANKEKHAIKFKERYQNDQEFRRRVLESGKARRLKDIAKTREYNRNYARLHPEKNIKWKKDHPEKCREVARNAARRYRATVQGAIHSRMSKALRIHLLLSGLSKRRKSWPSLLGYTARELKAHLESQFTKGMTWKVFKTGAIHIDHAIPKVKFKFNSLEDIEFKRCWALENLKPLWATDNLKKHDRILEPSQIPLGI